jgi:hypothetical protein
MTISAVKSGKSTEKISAFSVGSAVWGLDPIFFGLTENLAAEKSL